MGKHHSQEYRNYISRLVVEEGRRMTDLSYETGVPVGTIRGWVSRHRKKLNEGTTAEGLATPSDMEKQLRQYEKEMEELREENEILKKAMHVFAKNLA